ncbi:MAG: methyltransferase domain-containing protein, partial [bacterium]|nr:methyltransferase domain-containing protein [bacterium]
VSRITAIDVSPKMIVYARARHPSPIITFECAAIEEWEPQCYFDAVYCCEVIEHFEDAEVALRFITRLLRPGGVLCVSTPNRLRLENIARRCIGFTPVLVDPTHAREFSLRDLMRLGARHGLQTIVTRSVGAWAEWAFVPLRAFRWIPWITAFLRSDVARGRTHLNYNLGRLLGPFGAGLQVIFRKV